MLLLNPEHFEASHPPAAISQAEFTLRVVQSLSSVSLSGEKQMEIPALARMAPLFLSTPVFPACCMTRCVDFEIGASDFGVRTGLWERVLVSVAHPATSSPL